MLLLKVFLRIGNIHVADEIVTWQTSQVAFANTVELALWSHSLSVSYWAVKGSVPSELLPSCCCSPFQEAAGRPETIPTGAAHVSFEYFCKTWKRRGGIRSHCTVLPTFLPLLYLGFSECFSVRIHHRLPPSDQIMFQLHYFHCRFSLDTICSWHSPGQRKSWSQVYMRPCQLLCYPWV